MTNHSKVKMTVLKISAIITKERKIEMHETSNIENRLKNQALENNVCKLLLGINLTEEEITFLAHYTLEEIAEVALNVTSRELQLLKDPTIIIRATAVVYGQIASKLDYTSKPQKPEIFQENLNAIAIKRSTLLDQGNQNIIEEAHKR